MRPRFLFNPFPGLRAFEQHESHLFFGREAQSEELLRRLRQNRFVAVVGASGSGKSSLVRAGMLPALHGGFMATAGSSWRVAMFRPGNDPIGELARTLNGPEVYGGPDDEDAALQAVLFETSLRRSSLGLNEVVRQARRPGGEQLLVIVDQFEELFRFKRESDRGSEDAAAFVQLLLEASRSEQQAIYVVITMRSDYIGDCAQFRDLPETINDGQYLVPRMSRDQRRQAITGPVAVGGARISSRLVQRVLNDVGDNPDQLPILQHALMRTWDICEQDAEAEELDLQHYEAAGGMAKALNNHAEEIYAELETWGLGQVTERVFKTLTEAGTDNRGIRHPTRFDQLYQVCGAQERDVIEVIEAFRSPGRTFLMSSGGEELRPDAVVDISHESLMRVWNQLGTWVEQEAEAAQMYRRLAESVDLYGEGHVLSETELELALDWKRKNQPNETWAERYRPGFAQAIALLDRSHDYHQQERVQREEASKREIEQAFEEEARKRELDQAQAHAKRLKRAFSVIIVVLIAAIIMSGVAWRQSRVAEERSAEANKQAHLAQKQTRIAKAWRLIAESELGLLHHSGPISTLLAAKGLEATAELNDNRVRLAAEEPLREALAKTYFDPKQSRSLSEQAGVVSALAFSPDGQQFASLSNDDTVSLWEVNRLSAKPRMIPVNEGKPISIALSPSAASEENGRWLAVGYADGTVHVWNLNTASDAPQVIEGPKAEAVLMTFFADRTTWHVVDDEMSISVYRPLLAVGYADGTVQVWQIHTQVWEVHTLETELHLRASYQHQDKVVALSSVSDGHWGHNELISIGADHDLRFLNINTLLQGAVVENQEKVSFLSYHASGSMVSGSDNGIFRVWQPGGLAGLAQINRGTMEKVAVWAHSPRGEIASGGQDGLVRVWLGQDDLFKVFRGHEGEVTALVYNPDSQLLASGGQDSTVRIWQRFGSEESVQVFRGHEGKVTALAYSHDGDLASGGTDGTVRVWQRFGSEESVQVFRGHEGKVTALAYSHDGDLASGGTDGTVRVWQEGWEEDQHIFKVHESQVTALAYSPDGRSLAVGDDEGKVTVWQSSDSETPLHVFKGHEAEVSAVVFSPDGRTLVSSGPDGTIRLWAPTRHYDLGRWAPPIMVAAVSANGLRIAGRSKDGEVNVWSRYGGGGEWESSQALQGDQSQVETLAFSPDSQLLISSGKVQKYLQLWDMNNVQGEPRLLAGHTQGIGPIVFSPNGQLLASGGLDKIVRIWSTGPAEPQVLRGYRNPIRAVAVSPTGSRLASFHEDATILLWDLSDPLIPSKMLKGLQKRIDWGAFSQDEQYLVGMDRDHVVWGWHVSHDSMEAGQLEGKRLFANRDPKPAASDIEPSHVIIAGSKGQIVRSGRRRRRRVKSRALSQHWLAVVSRQSGRSGMIQLWPLNDTGREPVLFEKYEDFTTVTFSPDGGHLVGGRDDGSIWVWSMSGEPSAEPVHQLPALHEEDVTSLAFSADGRWFASGGRKGTVHMWDWPDRDARPQPQMLHAHRGRVKSVAFSADGRWFASGHTEAVRVWDRQELDAKPRIFRLDTYHVESVAFSANGRWLVSSGWDESPEGRNERTIRLWHLQVKTVVENLCRLFGRNPTYDEWQTSSPHDPYNYTKICSEAPVHPSVLEHAKQLARDGKIESAKHLFHAILKADSALEIHPEVDVKRLYEASLLVKEGEQLARQKEFNKAWEQFDKASEQDPDIKQSLKKRMWSLSSDHYYEVISNLLKNNQIDEVLNKISKQRRFAYSKDIEADLMYQSCHLGSIWGRADRVLEFCEKGVELEPDDKYAYQYRGIAYALKKDGDVESAIKDFERFISLVRDGYNDENVNNVKQWLRTLRQGGNPFDDAMLDRLRVEALDHW